MLMDMEGKEARHKEKKGLGPHLPGIPGGGQSRRGKRGSNQPTHLQGTACRNFEQEDWALIPFCNRCDLCKSFRLHLGFNPYKVGTSGFSSASFTGEARVK